MRREGEIETDLRLIRVKCIELAKVKFKVDRYLRAAQIGNVRDRSRICVDSAEPCVTISAPKFGLPNLAIRTLRV